MKEIKDLKALLTHEILDLYSAELQIIAALPAMIKKAADSFLQLALKEHLAVTIEQKKRLEEVQELLLTETQGETLAKKKAKPALSSLFGNKAGKQVCLGMKGLIEEGNKILEVNMSREVLNTALVSFAQKIEHYEICGYGTALAHARQSGFGEVAALLEQTLREEYEADERLTDLALGGINEEAEAEDPREKEWPDSGGITTGEPVVKTETPVAAPKKKKAPPKKSKSKTPEPKAKKTAKSRPADNTVSPGGRAGTSHRGPRGH